MGESSSEVFLIKELVTVTLLVEMPGPIWARQHRGLGASSELGLTGDTPILPLPCPPLSAHPRWPGTCHVSFPSPGTRNGSRGWREPAQTDLSPLISLPSSLAVSHTHTDTSFPMNPLNTQSHVPTIGGYPPGGGKVGQSWPLSHLGLSSSRWAPEGLSSQGSDH